MNIDQAREYVVVLNGGSGCLIQPMTDEYMYVLTAKHNITSNNNVLNSITYFKLTDGNWTSHEIAIANLTEGENYFPHPDKDIAIIKVPVLDGYDKAFRFDRITEEKDNFFLLGYPEVRRKDQPDVTEWFRRDNNIQILDPRNNGLFEATIPGNATLNEVRGDSGGAILKIIGDHLYVAGIQNRMAAANEQLGHVQFTPLSNFDEIIQTNEEKLAAIFPSHLKSFSFLKNEAFNINTAAWNQNNIAYVKNFLKNKTQNVIDSPLTPIGIKRLFEQRLILFKEKNEILQFKFIWLLWLELLTILNVLKRTELSEEALKVLFDDIRLICTDADSDWSYQLDNIAYSDFKGLKKNGTVIVGCKNPPLEDVYILDGKIPMITQVIRTHNRELLQIDEGINFPLSDYKFIHMEYFKKQAIGNKHSDYEPIVDDPALFEKLKNEYKILLNNE